MRRAKFDVGRFKPRKFQGPGSQRSGGDVGGGSPGANEQRERNSIFFIYIFYFSFFYFFAFLGLHLQHKEVPKLEVESEL